MSYTLDYTFYYMCWNVGNVCNYQRHNINLYISHVTRDDAKFGKFISVFIVVYTASKSACNRVHTLVQPGVKLEFLRFRNANYIQENSGTHNAATSHSVYGYIPIHNSASLFRRELRMNYGWTGR